MPKRIFKILIFLFFIPFLAICIYIGLYFFGSENKKLTEQDFTLVSGQIEDLSIIKVTKGHAMIDHYYVIKLKSIANNFCTVRQEDDKKGIIKNNIQLLDSGDTVSLKIKKDMLAKNDSAKEILIYDLISKNQIFWQLDINDYYEDDIRANIKAVAITFFVAIFLYSLLAAIIFRFTINY